MAISKILHMKDTGSGFHGKHLKSSIEYILNPEKTQNGRLVGGVNCQPDMAFEQMKETKRKFGKIDKRQGYHLILSFEENEASPNTAFEIAGKFAAEYLGKEYEAVYCVHDNTEHVHAHIVFNSVSFVDGRKYRYEKGDWAKEIQPITNRLCAEYGLSTLEIEEEEKGRKNRGSKHYREWNEQRDGRTVWADMIRRDLDACILQAASLQQFEEMLKEKGYESKHGKHFAVRPPGMNRFRRCDTLGENYAEEMIRERIQRENVLDHQNAVSSQKAVLVRCYVKRYKRAKLSGLQKRYYTGLYKVGKLKKKPYSQAWKYKEDIRRMNELQMQYLFLVRHDIRSAEELVAAISSLTDKKKESHAEKSRIYRARQKCRSLFDTIDDMDAYKEAHEAFVNGDDFFAEEEKHWNTLSEKLRQEGYSYEEVCRLRAYYRNLVAECQAKEKAVSKELRTGEAILRDLSESGPVLEEKKEKEKINEMGMEQPGR